MPDDNSALIELAEDLVRELIFHGFVRLAPDNVHEFTERGSGWLRKWCDECCRKAGIRA